MIEIEQMSPEWKIGQLLVAGFAGQTLGDDVHRMIAELHVGNVILMGANIAAPAQVLALTQDVQRLALEANGVGLLVATDQEGGQVQRLSGPAGFTPLPPAAVVGSARDADLIRRYACMAGDEMRAVGINLAFAPDLDVNDNPDNPVIGRRGRAFGTTPEQVTAAALPFIDGLHDAGVIATGKHFPGHGSTAADSHLALPTVAKDRAALDACELAPYRAAIAHGLDAIMTTHVAFPALDPSRRPATISAPILTGLLRDELGFQGLIVTDDLRMRGLLDFATPEEAAVETVLAGADLLCCVRVNLPGESKPDLLEPIRGALLSAVAEGRLPTGRLDESVRRILAVKERYQVGPASGAGLDRVGGAAHLRLVADVLAAAGRR